MEDGGAPDIPTFLRCPFPKHMEPRVLANVAPPLRFEAEEQDWRQLRSNLRGLMWESRCRRAAAWDGDLGAVLNAEREAHNLTEWLVTTLGSYGIEEAISRAWLHAFRQGAEAEALRDLEEG